VPLQHLNILVSASVERIPSLRHSKIVMRKKITMACAGLLELHLFPCLKTDNRPLTMSSICLTYARNDSIIRNEGAMRGVMVPLKFVLTMC
jgi:hypothetical protein